MPTLVWLCLLGSIVTHALAQQVEDDLTNTTILAFGTDFSAEPLHHLTFGYGLAVPNNVAIKFTVVPLAGITCGYEGNTNDECASMFHLFNTPGISLDFDGRHLQEKQVVTPAVEIDFAITPEPLVIDTIGSDLQNYPAFVYGIAPAFYVPGVEDLVLTRETLSRIFRGCVYINSPTRSPTGSPTQSPVELNDDILTATASDSAPFSPSSTRSGCFPGAITRWDHEAILESNPIEIHHLLAAAGEIKVIVNSDSDTTTKAFKRAISRFDDELKAQIGNNKNAVWSWDEFESVPGSYGALRKAGRTPGSITYGEVHQIAAQNHVRAAKLMVDEGRIVTANSASLHAAFVEIGPDFGNDGNDPSMMTVDLTKARGVASWPISLLAYVSMRKTLTLENCRLRKLGIMSFVEYFYSSQLVEGVDYGTAPITVSAGNIVLEHIRNNLRCDGELVYVPPPPPSSLEIYSDNALHTLLNTFLSGSQEGGYEAHVLTVTTYVSLREAWICRTMDVVGCTSSPLVAIADDNLSQYILEDSKMNRDKYELISIPYVAVATGFIYNFCKSTRVACDYRYKSPLVLDVTTAANILDGNIRWWNDSAIVKLNPTRRIPQEPIIVIAGPKYSSYSMDFVQRVRSSYVPDFAFRLGDEEGYERATFHEAWMDVALTPFSISFAVLNATVVEGVETVSLRNDQGVDVAASPATIEACAYDTYDEVNNVFRLDYSTELDCYPLTTTYTLFVATTLRHPAPAILLQTLYRQSLRSTQGDTAVFTNRFGTLIDLYVDGIDLAQLNLDLMERIIYPDTKISILRIPHELNLIPDPLWITLYVIMSIECATFIILALWTAYYRNRKLIRNSSPMFMLQVLFGATITAFAIIPLSMQDDGIFVRAVPLEELNTPQPTLDLACMAVPVLFSVGFAISFSAIFLKTWRLIRIFNNSKLRNLFLKDRQLMWYQLCVLIGVAGLNAFWLGLSPLSWERIPAHINEQGLVVSSTGICVTKAGLAPAAPMIIGIVGLLVMGNYLSYLARRIPTEFNESRWTAMSLFFVLEAFVIVVPVLILANDQPVSGYIVKALASLLLPIATVGFVFVPKLMIAYGIGEDKEDSNPWRFVRASDSSGNSKKIGAVVHEEPLHSKLLMSSQQPTQAHSATMSPTAQRTRNQLSTPPASGGSLSTSSKPTNEALAKVLRDDPTSRKFRRYLKTLHNEDNVRFWDATMITKTETNESKRYSGTRAVIQSFVCDHAPYRVNLPEATRDAIVSAYNNDDKEKLRDAAFFDQAVADMFDALRQSDEFRAFVENDAYSKHNLV